MRTWHSTLATMRLMLPAGRDLSWIYLPYFSMLTILIARNLDKQPDAAANAFLIFTLTSAVFGWLLVFTNRCLKLVRHTNQMRLPDCRKQIINAHVAPIIGLIVIPCVLFVLMNGAWTSAVIVCCAGMLGLMLPLVASSRLQLIGINIPTLLFVAPMLALSAAGIYRSIIDPAHTALFLLPTILLFAGLWLWHWRNEFSNSSQINSYRDTDRNVTWFQSLTYPRPVLQRIHRSPSAVVRMFIGAPYAPIALWQRLMQGCLLLISLLLLACSMYFSAGLKTWTSVEHVWQWLWPLLLYVLAVGYWIQYMDAATKSLGRTGLQISELALLPNMGNRRQQLRTFLWGMFGKPIQLVLMLLAVAIILRYQETHGLWYSLMLLVIGIIAINNCVGHMLLALARNTFPSVNPRHLNSTDARANQLRSAIWNSLFSTLAPMMFFTFLPSTNVVYAQLERTPGLASLFAILIAVAFGLPGVIGFYALYKLSRRPHPFVEINE